MFTRRFFRILPNVRFLVVIVPVHVSVFVYVSVFGGQGCTLFGFRGLGITDLASTIYGCIRLRFTLFMVLACVCAERHNCTYIFSSIEINFFNRAL